MMAKEPSVVVAMGSSSDLPAMQPAADVLGELGVPVEVRVVSAHRTPERALELAREAAGRGVSVLICGAGGAAHLAGVIAAHTTLPVIGVPLNRSLDGLDSLLATVQMPPGVPVATVGVDASQNAGLLAAAILALGDPALADRLAKRRAATAAKVASDDDDVRKRASKGL
jgi:5-(carboxyamino)imidazole ribonucleotide mutase